MDSNSPTIFKPYLIKAARTDEAVISEGGEGDLSLIVGTPDAWVRRMLCYVLALGLASESRRE